MKIQPKNKRNLLAAALGKINCDLAVVNTKYVNLFTGEIYPANVFVHEGFVVHVEKDDLKDGLSKVTKVIDAEGRYIIPGFIDSHIHIESSMMTPRNFAAAVVPHGTTTVVTDPHEIANVFGEDAVRYMHDAGCDLPMRQFIDIPSCVPAVPGLESGGAEFDATTIDRLAKLPNVIGLAEVMDFVGVVNGEDRMMDIIDIAEKNGLYLQGHAPFCTGRMLSAYLVGGPHTCHETREGSEAVAKLRAGMYVDTRESSIAKNAADIWNGVKDLPWRDRMSVCTDDREADDILENGHMNLVVRTLIKLGMDPLEAIRAATVHNAQAFHAENLGAVAPGFVADMLLVDTLEGLEVNTVFFGGEIVAKEGKLLATIEPKEFEIEKLNSMNAPKLSLDDFKLKAPNPSANTVKVNVLTYTSLNLSVTACVTEELPVKNGIVDLSGDPDLFYAMIINRYGTGNYTFGVVRGFGAKCGANGSTVSHDCHNLCIVFKDAESGFAVYNELVACGGGMCSAIDGKVTGTLKLSVGGLMSPDSPQETAKQITSMKKALHDIGLDLENPLLRIATLALPVIPEYKFSDLGLVNVLEKKLTPIFVD